MPNRQSLIEDGSLLSTSRPNRTGSDKDNASEICVPTPSLSPTLPSADHEDGLVPESRISQGVFCRFAGNAVRSSTTLSPYLSGEAEIN